MAKKGTLRFPQLIPILMGPICAGVMAKDAAGNLPKRVRLANWGKNTARGLGPNGTDAELIVNETTLKLLPDLQKARGYDTVTLDFEHQSDKRHPNYKAGPIETAGHGTISVVEGDGVFYEAKTYTPTGVKYAASYPDVSGVFWINPKREVILISSVALTLNGAVEGAEFREAADRYLAACIAAAMTGPLTGEDKKRYVTADMQGTDEEILAALGRELLGYADDATVEDVKKGLGGLLKAKRASAEAAEDDEDEDEDEHEDEDDKAPPTTKISATETQTETELTPAMSKEILDQLAALTKSVETLTQSHTAIAASVTQLKERDDTAAHNAAVETVITASIAAGKVVPASVKAKDDKGRYVMGADAAKEIMECIQASVQVDGQKTAKPDASKAGDITADEREAMLACGVTEDQWKAGTKHITRAFEPAASSALVS